MEDNADYLSKGMKAKYPDEIYAGLYGRLTVIASNTISKDKTTREMAQRQLRELIELGKKEQ